MARYALVIGIANYNNFRNLPKAVSDPENIARVLREHGRFDVQPLPGKLIEGENRWSVAPDKKLTGKELGSTLRKFLLEKAKNHEALIYFAGHGFEAATLTGKHKGYLATFDCTSDGQNAIAFDDFNDLIRESQLASLVVLLDCCYAGSFLEKSFLRSSFPVFNSKQDYCLITASREFEKAREDAEGGIFTQAILRGLSNDKADEATGEVNVTDLFSFISRELKQSGQEPIYMGGGRSIPLVWYPPKNAVVTGVVREECPYRGLEAFDKQHAQFFFGRKKVVEDILQKLAQAQFVAIIGASGSGKSSVVRAGLIPQWENNGWRVLNPIKPGIEPLAKLTAAFEPFFQRPREIQQLYEFIHSHPDGLHPVIERLPGSKRFLLVVDQFEEVFTLCPKEEERRRFIELLTQVVELSDATSLQSLQLAIVITMRADFLEPFSSYPSLNQVIQNQAVYIMPRLMNADLLEAIESPAKLQGYHFENRLLVVEIIQDVGTEQGCLPLLQFALTELWEKRDSQNHQLTVEQYGAMGGVIGALDRHAEAIYQSFTEQEQEWVKRIFLKLVRTGEGISDTRQRQPKAKLIAIDSDNVISDVLDNLIQGRLLVSGLEDDQKEAWVDLAHEALIENWQRLVEWRKETQELRLLINRLENAYREWQDDERSNENLMRKKLLDKLQRKWKGLEPYLDPELKEFYQINVTHQEEQVKKDSATAKKSENDTNQATRQDFQISPKAPNFNDGVWNLQWLKNLVFPSGNSTKSRNFVYQLINKIPDPIFVKNKKHQWILLNEAYCQFIGFPEYVLIGKSDYEFFPMDEVDAFHACDDLVFQTQQPHENEEDFTDARGITHVIATKRSLHKDADGNFFLVGVIRDITIRKRMEDELRRAADDLSRRNKQLKIKEDHLRYLAYHDSLTGLPNSKFFIEQFQESLLWAQENNCLTALLFIDLDGLKQVNDTFGHEIGDRLLITVARRITHCLRSSDTVSRLGGESIGILGVIPKQQVAATTGGDQFTVILRAIPKVQVAATFAEKILATLTEPIVLKGHMINISASIGISIYPSNSQDSETLIKLADNAMYRAKHLGKNRYEFAS